jgi:hypothetical protein
MALATVLMGNSYAKIIFTHVSFAPKVVVSLSGDICADGYTLFGWLTGANLRF